MRYLLITFMRKPGGQIDELVAVSKNIKKADLQTCNVIIDYGTKKVEKCIIEGKKVDTDFEKMNEYYKQDTFYLTESEHEALGISEENESPALDKMVKRLNTRAAQLVSRFGIQ